MNSNIEEALTRIKESEQERDNFLDLSYIDLTTNELSQLIPKIGRLPQLTSLALQENQLTDLPPEIGLLSQLTSLHLYNNQLTSLPPEIGLLSQLTSLRLNDNQLTSLPPEIDLLSQLTLLDISDNQLISLPPEIGLLSQLTSLRLYNNQLTSLPPEIGLLSQLTSLRLYNNQLTSLPPEIGLLSQLTLLDLSDNQLTSLPPEAGHWSQLTSLRLHSNQLTNLPPEIGHLSQLTSLRLNDNQLINLPSEIGRLSQLTSLDLYNNQLTSLPPEIGHLSQLTSLRLNDNQLINLPSQIGSLSSLIVLDIYKNQLTSLPSTIGQLTQLQAFYIDNNKLTELPSAFGQLANLNTLDLLFNSALDDKFEQTPNGNTDLTFPPRDIIGNDDIAAIRSYLQAIAQGHEDVWQSKCVVVGEGGVGKTWLIDALRGNQPDASIVGTVGIDILPLELTHPSKANTTMQLNCWDFAGQDFNHAMHQFFFSNRALILLVWNARHGWEQGKLTRWLENIKVRAPEAPVLLVATHIDEPHSGYPKEDLRTSYPQIKATIEVSSKEGTNIAELRDLIQQEAATLPLMGVKWPSTWLAAADTIRALGSATQTHTTRSHAYTLMREQGLNDKQCAVLLHWLHELGDLLNFADEEKIADYVILNPDWLTKHLGVVLRSDEVLARKGILSRQHLRELWHNLDEQIRTLFLHIMDKFDLAYLIPEDPEARSLIVERLPLDPPDYQPIWDEFADRGNEITLRFQLGSMHPGIPTWFIARCHRFTLGRGDQEGMHWINGVVFQDEQQRHRALIIANDHTRSVEMRVRGPFPQRFMSLLRDGFRDTLRRYEGLEVERWVPCNGYNELEEKPCSNAFRLDQLELRLEKRPDQTHFNCPDCDTRHARLALVEGIGSAELTQQLTEQRMKIMLEEVHRETRQQLGQQLERVSEQLAVIDETLKYQQRNFLRLFKQQQNNELITCPNLFTIRQVPRNGLIVKNDWEIQLWCQEPGAWHKFGKPYKIEEQHEIIGKALPFLKLLLKTLQFVAPLAGAALALTNVAGDTTVDMRAWADSQQDTFQNEVKMMDKFVKATEALADAMTDEDGEMMRAHPKRAESGRVKTADLAPVRKLMDVLAEQDAAAGRPKWRGLQRAFTPEGDILWLDQQHLETYLSKRKRPELSSELGE